MARILIIDDEIEMRDISSQIFELEGHEVATSADAEDALFKIKNNKYEVLLVDLVLPGKMNGLDIIKQARINIPRAHIIAYSGFSGHDITEKVIRAGADNFITKPFKRRELVDLVNAFTYRSKDKQAIIR
ncbi:MAG: response regulator [Calditrichaeota bacterium]|nr:response regulator [Calditrichota bacterium]